MKTRAELREEVRRIVGYELLADDFSNALINKKIQDAYSMIAKMSGEPIEFVERTYAPSNSSRWSNNKVYKTENLNLYGLWHVYRVWWSNNNADWYELKPSIYEEPERDKVFQGAQRIIPNPLEESRLTYPRIKLMSERTGQNTNQLPTSFAFINGKFVFDSHPATGSFQIRIVGSFVPHTNNNSPVKQLTNDTDITVFDEMLDTTLVYYATALLLDPYPDLIQFNQELVRKAVDYANTVRSLNMMSVLQYSPGGILESTQGITPPEENQQKPRNKKNDR